MNIGIDYPQQLDCLRFTPAPQMGIDGRWYTWSIGIHTGDSLHTLRSPEQITNPVLSARDVSDVAAAFVADPFMVRENGLWYMFFEVFNTGSSRGEIALATSRDGFIWDYDRVILREPFHMSYPYVFSWNGDYYLLPETMEAKSVRLYKAVKFPHEWEMCGSLIEQECADPSIFRFNGRWWMFACPVASQSRNRVRDSSLVLFHAAELRGPWTEHPASPIVNDNQLVARPAGRILVRRDEVIRFAQEKHNISGSHVRAFRVLELTASTYRETEIEGGPLLGPSGRGWNKSGMHHIDIHDLHDNDHGDRGYIACVDGVIRE